MIGTTNPAGKREFWLPDQANRLKDWRLVATRYDRCPIAVFSAIPPTATVIF